MSEETQKSNATIEVIDGEPVVAWDTTRWVGRNGAFQDRGDLPGRARFQEMKKTAEREPPMTTYTIHKGTYKFIFRKAFHAVKEDNDRNGNEEYRRRRRRSLDAPEDVDFTVCDYYVDPIFVQRVGSTKIVL